MDFYLLILLTCVSLVTEVSLKPRRKKARKEDEDLAESCSTAR